MIAVASTREFSHKDIPSLKLNNGYFYKRLKKTRFSRIICNLEYLLNWIVFPINLINFAKKFKPDLIFSVVDDWHMGLAWRLSRRLCLPLAVNFQDLFALSLFVPRYQKPYPLVRRFLIYKYFMLNRYADAVFYTSDGMKNWFDTPRGEILYPVGDFEISHYGNMSISLKQNQSIRLVYAGNCYGAYGDMLLKLIHELMNEPLIEFKIYAVGNDWSEDIVKQLTDDEIYYAYLPFDKLCKELAEADAFLTVMSFVPEERVFMETSFTTKWLDYVPFGKPIFVWGPEYSTAIQFSRRYGSGYAVAEDNPLALISTIIACKDDPVLWMSLSKGAKQVAENELNSNKIHETFRYKLKQLTVPKTYLQ